MSDTVFLPHEILTEILRRLLPKTLLRFTTVCKSWRSLITHPSFISLHHRHSPSFLHLQFSNRFILPHRHHHPSTTLRLPSFPHHDYHVVSFCNGLVCVAYGEQCQSIIVCNPCIRRFVTLPTPLHYPCYYTSNVALGFDSSQCDYKVVRISCMVDDERFGLSAPEVEVFSLATGSWRTLDHDITPVCYVAGDTPPGFHDGLVHWVAKRYVAGGWYNFVLSFHFEGEIFGEVMLPESLARTSWVMIKVIGGGNEKSLTVYAVDGGSPCSCNIWVMKEYGEVESWNKAFSFLMSGFCLEVPSLGMMLTDVEIPPMELCVTCSGEVLLLVDVAGRRCLYSLDIKNKSFTDLQIEIGARFVYSGYYAESLLLLNIASAVVY
ncbi:F-box protein 22 [Vigna unguiculata]|uniref:F-box protein 22 n=1 Tax=Vigna unguiculata TaxID=3917 RepID=A0A4D6N1X8_VIGUN|nr:F-box protein 22 [Vigna unguiculata]